MTPAIVRPTRRLRAGDDSGAVLVLALVVVTLIALVVGGLLAFTDTSMRTTVTLRTQGLTAAAADGAAQTAINALRLGSYDNDPSSSDFRQCFGATDTLVLPDLIPGSGGSPATSAAVQCTPDPDTGVAGVHAPVTPANRPSDAILTLGTNPAEEGLDIKALNNSIPFNVHGSITSNSTITVTNGALKSNAAVHAHTGCSGSILSTPAPVCGAAPATDPGYAAATTTVPAYQPVPANSASSCGHGVVTFRPGYYDDAAALSDLMSGNGACKGSVWWFMPGTYYFDFQNSTGAIPGIAGSDQWLVKDGQLVAGTPTDSTGAVLAAPRVPATVPGACLSPVASTAAAGVQFIFGGDSRLQVAGSADAEICGTYRTNQPPIAVYGLKTGTSTPTVATGISAAAVTTPVAGSGFLAPAGMTTTTALATADGVTDTWTADAAGGSATLDLSGFTAASAVPAGSIVSSAKLRIVYGASDAAANRSITVTAPTTAAAGTVTAPVPVTTAVSTSAHAASDTETVDLTSALAGPVHAGGLAGLSLGYTTAMSGAGTEHVDAVLLDLTYTVPTFRGETTAAVPGNCLAAAYTGGAGGQCAVLATATSYSGRFYVQGTLYAPIAPIDITLNNFTTQVMRVGIVARTLWAKETGSLGYTGPVVESPDVSPGFAPGGTVVYLTVYVCPGSSSCTPASGRLSLRIRVYIFDPSGVPAPPSRQMTVQSWALER